MLRIHRAYGVRVRVLREELENMLCRGGQALLVSWWVPWLPLPMCLPPVLPFLPPVGVGCCLRCWAQTGTEDWSLGTRVCRPLLLYWPSPSFCPSFLSPLSFDTILDGMKYPGSIIRFHSFVLKCPSPPVCLVSLQSLFRHQLFETFCGHWTCTLRQSWSVLFLCRI